MPTLAKGGNIMPSLPIQGSKNNLSLKEAMKLVREKKADGYKAFLESYPVFGKKKYQVFWY